MVFNAISLLIMFAVTQHCAQRSAVCGVGVPMHRDGGACFCTRGAMQGYDGYYFILALAKTVTPGGSPRREPGQAAPPTT